MDVPLGTVTALIFCRSGCGSLVACSVDLIVVSFEVFCALVGCITSSGVKRLSVCRGGAGSGGCFRPVGEGAIRLSGSGREGRSTLLFCCGFHDDVVRHVRLSSEVLRRSSLL